MLLRSIGIGKISHACVFFAIDSQGTSTAVAMDNTRQALQLCGKLLYAQMSEIVNKNLNNDLPPNLSGCDYTGDFGFKGMDVAMSAYMSELDLLTSKKILLASSDAYFIHLLNESAIPKKTSWNIHCEIHRNFIWLPGVEILRKGTVSAYLRAIRKISTPGNQVKLRYFSQWSLLFQMVIQNPVNYLRWRFLWKQLTAKNL